QSEPGEGSTFRFTLPLYSAAAQLRPPIVLVAAADDAVRREAVQAARDSGFLVHEVADGVEAVEAALRLGPAAIVLDRILPRLRAEDVVERLGQTRRGRRPVAVALVSAADLGDRAS